MSLSAYLKILMEWRFDNRRMISKFLLKIPKSLFPDYRININPEAIESNRKTLNFHSDASFGDFSSSSGIEDTPKKCCRYCRSLEERSKPLKINLRPEKHDLWQMSSTPKNYDAQFESWSEEVDRELPLTARGIPTPPPMPSEAFCETCAKFKAFPISKAPEVRDMKAVLRRRFAAMHSPLCDDSSIESDTDGCRSALIYPKKSALRT
ncbi:uncharacterized protein [Euwallacea fornicatus]|uniref:uncharacterized protein n=1 Tax=Euwallacea fornicatus TaxID=995702 RepID=UPI00338F77F9